MGGLLYTNAWTGTYVQVVQWHKYGLVTRLCRVIGTHRLVLALWAPIFSASRLVTPDSPTTLATASTSMILKVVASTRPLMHVTVSSSRVLATTNPCRDKVPLLQPALLAPRSRARISMVPVPQLGYRSLERPPSRIAPTRSRSPRGRLLPAPLLVRRVDRGVPVHLLLPRLALPSGVLPRTRRSLVHSPPSLVLWFWCRPGQSGYSNSKNSENYFLTHLNIWYSS